MTDVLEAIDGTTGVPLAALAAAADATGNGHVEQAELELDVPVAPPEKVARFGDPRREAVNILRDRLERVLQPVDEDEVWHGVNVVTAKDLHAAIALDLPPASIFSAGVRTPAFVYVSAVCPVCGIVSEIDLEIGAQLTVEGQSRKLKLKAKATAKPHQCGQQRLDDLAPTRPEQVSVEDGDGVAEGIRILTGSDVALGDVDHDEGDLEDQLEDALEATDRDAIHSIAGAKAPEASVDDEFSELPF